MQQHHSNSELPEFLSERTSKKKNTSLKLSLFGFRSVLTTEGFINILWGLNSDCEMPSSHTLFKLSCYVLQATGLISFLTSIYYIIYIYTIITFETCVPGRDVSGVFPVLYLIWKIQSLSISDSSGLLSCLLPDHVVGVLFINPLLLS